MSDVQTRSQKPLISVAIPVFNEEANVDAVLARLTGLSAKMQDVCDFEFIFSDNCSTDATWSKIENLAKTDGRVKAIRFSKNVGVQRSIFANFLHAQGDAIVQIDADLQDPPELIEEFVRLWLEGNYVVYGVRIKRKERWYINKFRNIGYWMIDKLSDHPIPRDAGDFRLIDRKVLQALTKMRTSNPYLRGVIANLGFQQVGVPYDREARTAGESKFNMWQVTRLGARAVINHSVVPLRAASLMGLIILGVSFVGVIYFAMQRIYHPEFPQGLTSIHILVTFGIGLNAFLLGIVGEYILRIYLILQSEPVAIVEQSVNFDASELKL
ncbi:MAG: glycosyltransferase family 2 protein [Thermoleophilaceae bacterium]|nr:glycosyltransferase family 2 protein [Thermoleophilaceae bacterium]